MSRGPGTWTQVDATSLARQHYGEEHIVELEPDGLRAEADSTNSYERYNTVIFIPIDLLIGLLEGQGFKVTKDNL